MCSRYGSTSTEDGYCYNGYCQTMDDQCSDHSYSVADTDGQCGYTPYWQIASTDCMDTMVCYGALINLEDDSNCHSTGSPPEDGTPCTSTDGEAAQCVGGLCVASSSVYTYKWTAFSWRECSIPCKSSTDELPGVQYRDVNCTLQDTSIVDRSLCDGAGDAPDSSRECNDFICNFCAIETICGDHGECDVDRGICDCFSGYGGEFCDILPSLEFMGITSQVWSVWKW